MSSESTQPETRQSWDPDRYHRTARFVTDLGQPVLDLLAPAVHERILDLGCGDGVLTAKVADHCREIVGVDASSEFIAAARELGLTAHVADGHALRFDEEFDAVMSNAALHWMTDPDAVIDGVWRALKPGGRFVGEKGGGHNVGRIRAALMAVLEQRGLDSQAADPWYFATVEDYRRRLEARGFVVESIALFERPTPLPGPMQDWLVNFGESFTAQLIENDRKEYLDEVSELLRDELCDEAGSWTADYVRLRFAARKPV